MAEPFNVAAHFVDRNVRERRGDRVAIENDAGAVSYRQLLQRTNRVGNALREAGVRREDRVVLLLLDSPEFLYSFYGAMKIGAVAVPVNTLLQPHEYEYVLNDTRAQVAVVSGELLAQIDAIPRERLPYLRTILVTGAAGKTHESLHDLMEKASDRLEPEPLTRDDPAFWLYSSGSTGVPKACVHLQHDMLVASRHYAEGILAMTGQDRCYSVPRLFFAYGLGNAGYFPLHVGGTTILSPGRPTPHSIFSDIERYRPTLFFSVPTNYAALLACEAKGRREFDLSSVRYAVSAGEALPAALYHRFRERFGVEILDAWGSTETLHMAIANRPGDVRPGSSGKVIPGYEAKIVDGDGHPVAQGELGNLLVKSDSTCAGYWNQHERTKDCFEGHWFRTGDKYYQDEAGYFWYAGRADDLFKVNGRWLSPVEVESALMAHPAVREAAVVARDDEAGLTKPVAYVVLHDRHKKSAQLTAELQDWVARQIGGYKCPRWIEYIQELPKTATGKLQRFRLREAAKHRAIPARTGTLASNT